MIAGAELIGGAWLTRMLIRMLTRIVPLCRSLAESEIFKILRETKPDFLAFAD